MPNFSIAGPLILVLLANGLNADFWSDLFGNGGGSNNGGNLGSNGQLCPPSSFGGFGGNGQMCRPSSSDPFGNGGSNGGDLGSNGQLPSSSDDDDYTNPSDADDDDDDDDNSNGIGLTNFQFCRKQHRLLVLDGSTNQITKCFVAYNNVARASRGIWPNGVYSFLHHKDHTADANGPYGLHGILIFNVRGRVGMGIHSGRANKNGPSHPTYGCIRTNDNAMAYLTSISSIGTLTVSESCAQTCA